MIHVAGQATLWVHVRGKLHCIILYQAWSAYFSSLLQDQNTAQPGYKREHEGRKEECEIKNLYLIFHHYSCLWGQKQGLPVSSCFLLPIMTHTIPPCVLQALRNAKGVEKEMPESHPRFHLSKVIVVHSVKITTHFFQKMALIYGSHVTVKDRLFLFQYLIL